MLCWQTCITCTTSYTCLKLWTHPIQHFLCSCAATICLDMRTAVVPWLGRGGERRDGWGAEKWKNRGFSFRVFLKKLTSFCVSKVKSIGGMEGGLKKNFNGLVKPTLKVFLNLKLIRTLILFKLCACFLHFLMIPYAIPEYVAIRPATHNRQNAVITWKFKRKQSTSHLLCALK